MVGSSCLGSPTSTSRSQAKLRVGQAAAGQSGANREMGSSAVGSVIWQHSSSSTNGNFMSSRQPSAEDAQVACQNLSAWNVGLACDSRPPRIRAPASFGSRHGARARWLSAVGPKLQTMAECRAAHLEQQLVLRPLVLRQHFPQVLKLLVSCEHVRGMKVNRQTCLSAPAAEVLNGRTGLAIFLTDPTRTKSSKPRLSKHCRTRSTATLVVDDSRIFHAVICSFIGGVWLKQAAAANMDGLLRAQLGEPHKGEDDNGDEKALAAAENTMHQAGPVL